MSAISVVIQRAVLHNHGMPQLIQHLLKVYAFTKAIAEAEGLQGQALETLEIAAILHDIGIRDCLEKYGHCNGPEQEKEGPPIARTLMEGLNLPSAAIKRVEYLIGHHHSYQQIDGLDYQILVEADFLVNLFEGDQSAEAVRSAYHKYFRTATGRQLCRAQFDLE